MFISIKKAMTCTKLINRRGGIIEIEFHLFMRTLRELLKEVYLIFFGLMSKRIV